MEWNSYITPSIFLDSSINYYYQYKPIVSFLHSSLFLQFEPARCLFFFNIYFTIYIYKKI